MTDESSAAADAQQSDNAGSGAVEVGNFEPGSVQALQNDKSFTDVLQNPLHPNHNAAMSQWDAAIKAQHEGDTGQQESDQQSASGDAVDTPGAPEAYQYDNIIPNGLEADPDTLNFGREIANEVGASQAEFDTFRMSYEQQQLRILNGQAERTEQELRDDLERIHGKTEADKLLGDARAFIKGLTGPNGDHLRLMLRGDPDRGVPTQIDVSPAFVASLARIQRRKAK